MSESSDEFLVISSDNEEDCQAWELNAPEKQLQAPGATEVPMESDMTANSTEESTKTHASDMLTEATNDGNYFVMDCARAAATDASAIYERAAATDASAVHERPGATYGTASAEVDDFGAIVKDNLIPIVPPFDQRDTSADGGFYGTFGNANSPYFHGNPNSDFYRYNAWNQFCENRLQEMTHILATFRDMPGYFPQTFSGYYPEYTNPYYNPNYTQQASYANRSPFSAGTTYYSNASYPSNYNMHEPQPIYNRYQPYQPRCNFNAHGAMNLSTSTAYDTPIIPPFYNDGIDASIGQYNMTAHNLTANVGRCTMAAVHAAANARNTLMMSSNMGNTVPANVGQNHMSTYVGLQPMEVNNVKPNNVTMNSDAVANVGQNPNILTSVGRNHMSTSVGQNHMSTSVGQNHMSTSVGQNHMSAYVGQQPMEVNNVKPNNVTMNSDAVANVGQNPNILTNVGRNHMSTSVGQNHMSTYVEQQPIEANNVKPNIVTINSDADANVGQNHMLTYVALQPMEANNVKPNIATINCDAAAYVGQARAAADGQNVALPAAVNNKQYKFAVFIPSTHGQPATVTSEQPNIGHCDGKPSGTFRIGRSGSVVADHHNVAANAKPTKMTNVGQPTNVNMPASVGPIVANVGQGAAQNNPANVGQTAAIDMSTNVGQANQSMGPSNGQNNTGRNVGYSDTMGQQQPFKQYKKHTNATKPKSIGPINQPIPIESTFPRVSVIRGSDPTSTNMGMGRRMLHDLRLYGIIPESLQATINIGSAAISISSNTTIIDREEVKAVAAAGTKMQRTDQNSAANQVQDTDQNSAANQVQPTKITPCITSGQHACCSMAPIEKPDGLILLRRELTKPAGAGAGGHVAPNVELDYFFCHKSIIKRLFTDAEAEAAAGVQVQQQQQPEVAALGNTAGNADAGYLTFNVRRDSLCPCHARILALGEAKNQRPGDPMQARTAATIGFIVPKSWRRRSLGSTLTDRLRAEAESADQGAGAGDQVSQPQPRHVTSRIATVFSEMDINREGVDTGDKSNDYPAMEDCSGCGDAVFEYRKLR